MAIKIVTKIDKVISLPREEMHQTMENRPGYLGVHGDKRSETLYKLNCYIDGDNITRYDYKVEDKGNYTELYKSRLKISFTGQEPIFSNECLDMARFRIEVSSKYVHDFEKDTLIELKLFYGNNIDECSTYVHKLLK